MKKTKDIVAFVELAPKQAISRVREAIPGAKILLLRDIKTRTRDAERDFEVDYVEHIDFSSQHNIAKVLKPYLDRLMVITARGEGGASRLGLVVPHVPYLRTPTPESLKWATDKYEMRKRMKLFNPSITPPFTKVKDATKKEIERVISKVGFPMVVKPANLQESMLVTICYHEEELEKTLKHTFRKLRTQYKKHNRIQLPTIMAEGFMDGDMYSIDSYVDSRGTIWHCPLVRVKTGRNIGHDDFYNYLQMTPTPLKRETVERAQHTAEEAVHALGLRSVTAHIELMKIDDEWKVIEVGPRLGGFRTLLYELSCDIDHSLNDIKIRMPKKPHVPKKCKGYAAAMKWFAKTEGEIAEMKGVKKIEELESFHEIAMNKKVGDRAYFSKNGGKSIFNLFLYNPDRAALLADIRRVEQMVEIKIKARGSASGSSKKAATKTKKK